MRIISGRFRSVPLASLGKGDAAAHLRPTADRVRESLFNVLDNHAVLDAAQVLDLFAGTGALGLEALSRGAAHVTFVDNGRVAARLIRENIAGLRVQDETRLISRDARALPPCETAPCDLVFLDPPYGRGLGQPALARAVEAGWLAASAFIVWEDSGPVDTPDGFDRIDQRRYGDTWVTLLSKRA